MAELKERMILLSAYDKQYALKYDKKPPQYNKWAEQWAADALIESYGLSKCCELLEYYFSVAENPTWTFFSYNAEKILSGKLDVEQDIRERQERRKKAREWLSE